MKITRIEVVTSRKPIPLPTAWRPAWSEPDIEDQTSVSFSFFKVHTDEGLVGIGPAAGRVPVWAESVLIGQDPTHIARFFDLTMRGRGPAVGAAAMGGLEIALWDLVGKSAGMPIYKLLGAARDRVPAYAATSQLKSAEESIRLARQARSLGYTAIKLRMHRADPWEDVAVVRAVREAEGPVREGGIAILVDANQNNESITYPHWDRRTALRIGRALQDLDVDWLEEPLPRSDLVGLAELCNALDMPIVGGEHCASIYEFRDALFAGAYDLVQPDVILGQIGISGLCKVAVLADAVGRAIVPHVCGGGNNGFYLAATLHALGSIASAPYLEYTFDPPALPPELLQLPLKDKLLVEPDGCVRVPDGPGLGIEIDEDAIAPYL